MSDEPIIALIDSAEQRKDLPEYDENIKCPDHPGAPVAPNYGLAGGGIGMYTVCAVCSRVLSKTQDDQYAND